MTFEEWYAQRIRGWSAMVKDMATVEIVARDAWDAATFAANNRAGDAGNEGEKADRLETAMVELNQLFKGYWNNEAVALRTIIAKCQG
jgi:hypothetical protein